MTTSTFHFRHRYRRVFKLTISLVAALNIAVGLSWADYTLTTVAGGGTPLTFPGDGMPATKTSLGLLIFGFAYDAAGSIYFCDFSTSRVVKIDSGGIITTVAGTGVRGFTGDGGPATSAQVSFPRALAFDSAGNLYIADSGNNRIRKVDTSGRISTIAGTGTSGFAGDGGPAIAATLAAPSGLIFDGAGNLLILDTGNATLRKVDATGTITTLAGNGTSGYAGDGGPASAAILNQPATLAIDGSGRIYISDQVNCRIRRIDTAGVITTIAGTGTAGYGGDGAAATNAQLNYPAGISFDHAGNLLVADRVNSRIRKIDSSGIITTIAGNGTTAFAGDGGPATSASLTLPYDVVETPSRTIFIADGIAARIRKVSGGVITTAGGGGTPPIFSGDGFPATQHTVLGSLLAGVTSDGSATYFSDYTSSRLGKVDANGIITTFAGNGTQGISGDGGPATSAQIKLPLGLAADGSGAVYLCELADGRVRKVDRNGIITSFAGNGTYGFSGDGGPATAAMLSVPYGIAWAAGNLYIADRDNNRIRRVDSSGTITTVAGNGTAGYSGDGGPAISAALKGPTGVAANSRGELFIADNQNHRVRKVDVAGVISTIAGNGTASSTGDAGPATLATVNMPFGVAVDQHEAIYIGEVDRVRKIDAQGIISTVVGGGTAFPGENGPATAAVVFSNSIFSDPAGNLLIGDGPNHRIRKATLATSDGTSLSIATLSPLPNGRDGAAYRQTLVATGGTTPYHWSVTSGVLPDGLALSDEGILGGTCGTAGAFSFRVTVNDGVGATAQRDFQLTVRDANSPDSPTPVKNVFFLSRGERPSVHYTNPSGTAEILVYDRFERRVAQFSDSVEGEHDALWPQSSYAAGVYAVRVKTSAGHLRVKTILVK